MEPESSFAGDHAADGGDRPGILRETGPREWICWVGLALLGLTGKTKDTEREGEVEEKSKRKSRRDPTWHAEAVEPEY